MKCSSSCGDGTKYREVYCKDDQTSLRLSGHMCNKNNIPTTEEKCRETRCNSIDNDLEPTHSYSYNLEKSTSDASKEKVGHKNKKLYFVSVNFKIITL